MALTGGTIAERIHAEVARLSPGSEVDWTRVHVWWGDERFVDPGSSERNAAGARSAFLDQVGVPADRVHEMASTADAESAAAGAAAYAAALHEHGTGEFDIVMLGVGPDGHVASLFPGFPQLDDDGIAVAVADSPKPPPERISLTFPALNRARSVWFLVSGDAKAEAVARALAGTDGSGASRTDLHEIPATGVSGREETIWFLDRDSASRL